MDTGRQQSMEAFKTEVCRKKSRKTFKVRNSWGMHDIYKAIRKKKWEGIGHPLAEHEFSLIIKTANRVMTEALMRGERVELPEKMGALELRKYERGASIKDGRLKVTYPVDWKKTLELWYEDEEAYRNKTLVRSMTDTVYRIHYDKRKADYENKCFYEFRPVRSLKAELCRRIESGDTYTGF